MTETPTRVYRSARRDEQAAETRRRILDAAAAVFAELGYSGTTMPEIARRAGVSTETVKAAGQKPQLLLGAFEQVFGGRESRELLHERDDLRSLMAVTDDNRFLEVFLGFATEANATVSRLWPAFTSAALSDPAVDTALQDLLGRRRGDFAAFVAELDRRGAVTLGIDRDELASALSFLYSPEGYQQLVNESGWSRQKYTRWLIEQTRRLTGASPVSPT